MAYPHHNLAGLGETGELVGIIFEDFETSSDTMVCSVSHIISNMRSGNLRIVHFRSIFSVFFQLVGHQLAREPKVYTAKLP